jgi:L-amino acid N-acyltransferase YncA
MLKRIQDKVRTLGWADASWFTIDWLLRLSSFGSVRLVKYYFVAQPVAARATILARPESRTRLYVTQNINDVIRQAARPAATLQRRFEQRAHCVLAEREGRLAGFIWLCPGRYVEDSVRCVYRWTPENAAMWDFDVFVEPPLRMGRLFSQLWQCAHALLDAQGVRWTLSRIDAFNAGSLAAHRRLGAVNLARAWFVRAGRFQVALSSQAPRWHFSARDDDAPQFCFDLSQLLAAAPVN